MFTQQNITSGLIGHWPINDGSGTTITDLSGNGHHGTIKDEVGSWVLADAPPLNSIAYPPRFLESSYYNFNKDVIEIDGSGTHTDFQMVKDFTLMAWVNLTSYDPYTIWLGKGWGTATWGIVFNTPNELRFQYSDGTNSDAMQSDGWMINMNDVWQHIGVSLDNSTPAKITFWMNGVSEERGQLSYDIVAHDRPFSIGGHPNVDNYRVEGGIADVRLFNRQLSESEWRQIYQQATYFKNAQI